MKTIKLLRVVAAGILALVGQKASAITIDINSTDVGGAGPGLIRFVGTGDTFSFINAPNGFSFAVGMGGIDGLGSISGTYTIGAISISGALQTASVTGSGTITIDDNGTAAGGNLFTGTITWIDIFTFGTGGGLNAGGAVNLTGITYSGANADLLALRNGCNNTGIAAIQFGFIPAKSLTNLTANGAVNDSIFTGDLTSVAGTGAALDFDGLDDQVSLGTTLGSFGTGNFTIEFWVKTTASSGAIYSKRSGCGCGNFLEISLNGSGKIRYEQSEAGCTNLANMTGNLTINNGAWRHVAVVRNGSAVSFFVDGALDKTATPSPTPANINNANVLRLGQGACDRFGGGALDELRIWSVARTGDQIAQQRNCEFSGAQCGLLAYYKFNQGTTAGCDNSGVTTLIDSSGNGKNGTLSGFALNGMNSNWIQPGGVASGTICGAVTAPEINLKGNNVSIVDGDSTPSAADHTDFGSINVTSGTVTHTFTIQNTGTAALTVSGITKSGANTADFTIGTLTPASPIAAGGSATFIVTFDPTGTSLRTATVNISNSDCDEGLYDFAIQGTGLGPEIVVEQPVGTDLVDGSASIDFGSVNTGSSSAAKTFTIKNTGTADLTGLAITKDGSHATDFTVGALGATTVAPGARTTFTVTFSPGAAGARSAAIHIASYDADENPFDITLTGTGLNAPPVAGADILNRPNNTRVAKVLMSALLANDTDADSDTLGITAVGNAMPSGATVALAGNWVIYTAATTNAGNGSFEYTLSDGAGGHTVNGSATVNEVVPPASTSDPSSAKIVASGNNFTITFIGVSNCQYRVQYSLSVAPYLWTEFSPQAVYTASANGVFSHTDANPPDPMRFYRGIPDP